MKERAPGMRSLAGTRGRIIDLIRRSPTTVTEIAAALDLTYNAVRGHLTALERDGLVRTGEPRRGGTRPAAVYELAPGVDDALSRAYMPFASQLVRTLTETLPEGQLDDIMRIVGRRLSAEWPRPGGAVTQRVESASQLLQELGAPNEVRRTNGTLEIHGFGCLLAAAVHGKPHVCRAMEALLGSFIGAPVRECCDRGERPRCCFSIDAGDGAELAGTPNAKT
jgi:predicted ArsR family transcriptional regulator